MVSLKKRSRPCEELGDQLTTKLILLVLLQVANSKLFSYKKKEGVLSTKTQVGHKGRTVASVVRTRKSEREREERGDE